MGKIAKGAKTVRVNDRIRVAQVRLVDEDGGMVGITGTREALEIAREKGFDLVEVSPNAKPPVCRIMDYGKYKYEQSKKAKRAKKKQHIMHIKEVKMRPKIEPHDYDFKMNHARRFLEQSNKVKFSLLFRGREVTHPDIGLRILKRAAEELSDIANVESAPKRERMSMIMILCPRQVIKKDTDKSETHETEQVTEGGDGKD